MAGEDKRRVRQKPQEDFAEYICTVSAVDKMGTVSLWTEDFELLAGIICTYICMAGCLTWRKLENIGYHTNPSAILRARVRRPSYALTNCARFTRITSSASADCPDRQTCPSLLTISHRSTNMFGKFCFNVEIDDLCDQYRSQLTCKTERRRIIRRAVCALNFVIDAVIASLMHNAILFSIRNEERIYVVYVYISVQNPRDKYNNM